jgi:3',5'-cyclic AMP phosphodiesterase CpdA
MNYESNDKSIIIAQISDIHIGSVHFVPDLLNRAIVEINELKPDLVVVTGDLTTDGYRKEYTFVLKYLEQIKCKNKIIVPGNHDSRNVGYLHFEEFFGERNKVLYLNGLTIVGADSSEPDLDNGQIGRENYNWIEERFAEGNGIKIFALHHHLIPVPGTGRERNIVNDAGDVLERLIDSKVNIVLCGHKHVPYTWRFENMLFVNAGTVSTTRLRGNTRPCYNIITISEESIKIIRRYPFGEVVPILDILRGYLESIVPTINIDKELSREE